VFLRKVALNMRTVKSYEVEKNKYRKNETGEGYGGKEKIMKNE
jgi:hypothetical protein